jgi:oligopeptide transport system substrate-binding protein
MFFCLAAHEVKAKSSDAIQIQIGGEPSTLDPARVIDQYGFGIMANVMEGLFRLDSKGGLQNGLAESYEISKNALKYRFHLKKDAKWSDGKPVNAEDFIFGLRRLFDPKTASPNAEFLFAIRGAKDAYFGKSAIDQIGVTKDGVDLIIELAKPDPTLLFELTFPSASPLRKDVFDAHHGVWSFRFPTTGNYTIATYRPSDLIELKPNPFYLNNPGRRPIRYRVLTEEITAMNLFEAGRLDVISNVTLTELERLKKKGLVQIFPGTTVFYFSFNISKPPFNEPEWRRAVASSLDREGIARVLNGAF